MKDPYAELIFDYLLDLLPEEMRLRVHKHLESGCADCSREVQRLQEILHSIPFGLANATLSAAAKRRIDLVLDEEESGRQRISHYRILRKLGFGAMGEVYLAEDTKLGRSTALKIIRPGVATDVERRKRFLREARAAAILRHPAIATIYEIGEDQGTEFIAMEYVEGRPLSEIIAGKALDPDRILRIALQLAGALAEAHECGILHRDLKPENVQIGAQDHAKILDFGLAKFMEKRLDDDYLTSSDRIVGTIPYMSPEQIEGQPLDARSDLFSLGSILYEMASGKSPFSADTPAETLNNILNSQPEPLSRSAPAVAPALQRIIHKCLQKKPQLRYASAKELEADLKAVANGQLLEAVPATQVTAPPLSIAVLYFENLSEEKESDYFRAGMTEDIIMELSKIRAWEVRPRTQVVQYKDRPTDTREVADELKVTHVIQGSIRKSGNRIRISAQLVEARTAAAVWAERYDRDLKDIFEIQSEIAQQIAHALQVHLTVAEKKEIGKRHTENLEAYDSYLRGREMIFRLTRVGIDDAILYFQQAIRTDSKYALAYAGLAQAYGIKLSFYGGSVSLADLAIENAHKALDLDPTLAQADAALGLALFLKGKSKEALEACQRAIALNPYDAFATWISGRLFYRLTQYEEAILRFKRTVDLLPDFYTAYSDLSQAYQNMGMPDRATEMEWKTAEACRRYLQSFPDEPRAHIFLASSCAWLGNREEAISEGKLAASLSPDDPVMMYNLACLYSVLEQPEEAIQWLMKWMKSGGQDFDWMKKDPSLDNIRNHPAYKRLLSDAD